MLLASFDLSEGTSASTRAKTAETFLEVAWRSFLAFVVVTLAIGQAPPQRRRIINAMGHPCIRRGSFRFAGILPRRPA